MLGGSGAIVPNNGASCANSNSARCRNLAVVRKFIFAWAGLRCVLAECLRLIRHHEGASARHSKNLMSSFSNRHRITISSFPLVSRTNLEDRGMVEVRALLDSD